MTSPDPTAPVPDARVKRPAPLVVAASLAALEGVTLLGLAALETASIDADRVSLGVSTAVFFALVGAAVLTCAWGLFGLRSWARGPVLLMQLITLGLAWNVKDVWVVSVVLAGGALVALAGMLHPDTMRALGALPEER